MNKKKVSRKEATAFFRKKFPALIYGYTIATRSHYCKIDGSFEFFISRMEHKPIDVANVLLDYFKKHIIDGYYCELSKNKINYTKFSLIRQK